MTIYISIYIKAIKAHFFREMATKLDIIDKLLFNELDRNLVMLYNIILYWHII